MLPDVFVVARSGVAGFRPYTPSVPARRTLAVIFGAVLTCYSIGWMYLIRQESGIVLGMEPRLHPLAHELEVAEVLPVRYVGNFNMFCIVAAKQGRVNPVAASDI